jgi:hypothetical protein
MWRKKKNKSAAPQFKGEQRVIDQGQQRKLFGWK